MKQDYEGMGAGLLGIGVVASLGLMLLLGQSGSRAEAVWSPVLTAPEQVVMGQASPELPEQLIAMGRAVGIKLFSDGVLVVGQSPITTTAGAEEPWKSAGVKTGDVITHVEGVEVNSIEDIQTFLAENTDETVDLAVRRGERQLNLTLSPAENEDGKQQLGLWLRDSMAGIGTITYCDPATGAFVALGHGVNDTDTAMLMPLEHGSIMPATVSDVQAGTRGTPGELHGVFDVTCDLGTLQGNTETGLYGTLDAQELMDCGTPLPVAQRSEVKTGEATIRCNISGDAVEEFTVNIREIYPASQGNTKNMMVEVTDERLLEQTGGIVQGMSGSPLVQNGKLIGAVTHVLVNDPTCGYGILIENMLATGETLEIDSIA